MRKLIKVSKEWIDNGTPRCLESCPVALAIKDTVPNEKIMVGTSMWSIRANMKWTEGYLPRTAIKFIKDFDGRKKVKPFNFYLEV